MKEKVRFAIKSVLRDLQLALCIWGFSNGSSLNSFAREDLPKITGHLVERIPKTLVFLKKWPFLAQPGFLIS